MESARHSSAENSPANVREIFPVFQSPTDVRSIAISGIFVLLIFYSLYFARDFLLPVILAFVLSSLLAPAVRCLSRIHITPLIGAAVIIAGLLSVGGYGTYRLSEPARQWLEKAPGSLNTIRLKFRRLLAPVEKARQTTEQIEKITGLSKDNANVQTVEIKKPGLGDVVFTGTQNFLILLGLTIVLLYFLLASGDLFLLKLVKILPTEDKDGAVRMCRQIERDVSVYLWTITLINCGLGVCVGAAMYFLGMPNPALWGVMAAFVNYVPYLGALTGIISVGVAAALTFDDPLKIILPPAIYFFFAVLEGNFITPLALGRSLALSPVVIFIWLIFWGWAWGVIGVVLAVPLLAIVKLICDHFKPLSAFSEFLGKEHKAVFL